MSKSIVYKGKVWDLLEYYDKELRKKLIIETEKRCLEYTVEKKRGKDGEITVNLILTKKLPFNIFRLHDEKNPLYFSFENNPQIIAQPLSNLLRDATIKFTSQGKMPLIEIPAKVLKSFPEIITKKKLYLFEKVIDSQSKEEIFLPFGSGSIYLLTFQLEALRNLWNEISDIDKEHKLYLKGEVEPSDAPKVSFELRNDLKNKHDWDEDQLDAFKKISSRKPFNVLNGFAGSGKTEVIQSAIQSLSDYKVITLSHDHAVVDLLNKKYEEGNPDVIFYRIGNNEKAINGVMGKHHIINKKKEHHTEVIQNVGKRINELKKNVDERYEILEEWSEFLAREEGEIFFEKITLNSARALFCTNGGLHYYIKKGLLDKFLPFDFCFIDEGSMIELPYLIHASQFSHTNIIAGDKNLVQPLSYGDIWYNKPINAIEELERTFSSSLPGMFTRFKTQYRICSKIFSIIHKIFYPNEEYKDKSKKLNDDEKFEVAIQKPYLSDDPITLIDITTLGPKVKQKDGVNVTETEIIQDILKQLDDKRIWTNPNFKGNASVWITSLFQNQIDYLKDKNKANAYQFHNLNINVETIRRFTGDQANVVIWTITYAPGDFLKKTKIKNLPRLHPNPLFRGDYIYDILTRVKDKLIIIGSKNVLLKVSEQMNNNSKKYNEMGKVIAKIIEEATIIEA